MGVLSIVGFLSSCNPHQVSNAIGQIMQLQKNSLLSQDLSLSKVFPDDKETEQDIVLNNKQKSTDSLKALREQTKEAAQDERDKAFDSAVSTMRDSSTKAISGLLDQLNPACSELVDAISSIPVILSLATTAASNPFCAPAGAGLLKQVASTMLHIIDATARVAALFATLKTWFTMIQSAVSSQSGTPGAPTLEDVTPDFVDPETGDQFNLDMVDDAMDDLNQNALQNKNEANESFDESQNPEEGGDGEDTQEDGFFLDKEKHTLTVRGGHSRIVLGQGYIKMFPDNNSDSVDGLFLRRPEGYAYTAVEVYNQKSSVIFESNTITIKSGTITKIES